MTSGDRQGQPHSFSVRVTQSMQLPGNKVELIESYGGTLTSFQCALLIYCKDLNLKGNRHDYMH
ncbi:hypothetical protein EJ02DRAFT_458703 [Clathrospora elynae]|uniref:Uncharacterized protein n=1 Tax=Clathrospora elynae TaxID=706981 RepID=A0A6A5SA09_9PLEO|nr:hypothetical protein EJ02DRAFT_458703 [Clathrospora elynae]